MTIVISNFTSIEINWEVRPQSVICATVLNNDALKPAKLERHLKTVHPNFSNKSPKFFAGKLENLKKIKLGPSGSRFATSEKACRHHFRFHSLLHSQ